MHSFDHALTYSRTSHLLTHSPFTRPRPRVNQDATATTSTASSSTYPTSSSSTDTASGDSQRARHDSNESPTHTNTTPNHHTMAATNSTSTTVATTAISNNNKNPQNHTFKTPNHRINTISTTPSTTNTTPGGVDCLAGLLQLLHSRAKIVARSATKYAGDTDESLNVATDDSFSFWEQSEDSISLGIAGGTRGVTHFEAQTRCVVKVCDACVRKLNKDQTLALFCFSYHGHRLLDSLFCNRHTATLFALYTLNFHLLQPPFLPTLSPSLLPHLIRTVADF